MKELNLEYELVELKDFSHGLTRERESIGDYYEDIVKQKLGITGYWQVSLFSDKGILQSAKGVA